MVVAPMASAGAPPASGGAVVTAHVGDSVETSVQDLELDWSANDDVGVCFSQVLATRRCQAAEVQVLPQELFVSGLGRASEPERPCGYELTLVSGRRLGTWRTGQSAR